MAQDLSTKLSLKDNQGRGLSKEDFSTHYRQNLDGIADGAGSRIVAKRILSVPLVFIRTNSDGSASASGNMSQVKNTDNSVSINGYTDASLSNSLITSMQAGISTIGLESISVEFTPSFFLSTGGPCFGIGFQSGSKSMIFLWRSDGQLCSCEVGTGNSFLTILPADPTKSFTVGETVKMELVFGTNSTTIRRYKAGEIVSSQNQSFVNTGNALIGMRGSMNLKYTFTSQSSGLPGYAKTADLGLANPKVFYEYSTNGYNDGQVGSAQGTGQFYVYVKYADNSPYYARYRIARLLNDLIRADVWRVTGCDLYLYSGGLMVAQGVNILTPQENEFVFKEGISDSTKADFTGGYHGDEIMSEVYFYVNGVRLSSAKLSSSIPLTAADTFWYIQKSDMFETETLGESALATWNATTNIPVLTASSSAVSAGQFYVVSVAGTTPFAGTNFSIGQAVAKGDILIKNGTQWTWRAKVSRCTHMKWTTFRDGTFNTKNSIIATSAFTAYLTYFDLTTVSRSLSEMFYSEDAIYVPLVADGIDKIVGTLGARDLNYFNSANSLGAFVTGQLTSIKSGSTDNTSAWDSACQLLVWDTQNYAKRYRKMQNRTAAVGDKWSGEKTFKPLKL